MYNEFKRILSAVLLQVLLIYGLNAANFIVAADGSGTHNTVQAAIDACPNNERCIIFIKNGTYFGQTYLGTKTTPTTKLVSLIGESRDGVILTFDKALPNVTKFEDATTFQIYAKDFYAENITFANTAGVSAGQALALYTAGDRATFKNCYLKGFQDTYRSKKGTRAYLKDCKIEGTVDFIYAGGTVFFDDCELHCLQGGGYIVAPEDAYQTIPRTATVCDKFLRLGFIFRNCDITAQTGVADNSYYLGRPWNTTAGAFYLNCKLGKHINPKGWKEWNGSETTASFAEYNSMNADGTLADVSGRVSWSFQLPEADVTNLFTTAGIYSRISSELYQPEPICVSPVAPNNVSITANQLQWNNVENVTGYIVFKDGSFLATVPTNSYTDNSGTTGIYTVKSVGSYGQLSLPATITSTEKVTTNPLKISFSDKTILFSKPVTFSVYNVQGIKLFSSDIISSKVNIGDIPVAAYIVKTQDEIGTIETNKFIIAQ